MRALTRADGPEIDADPLVEKPRAELRSLDLSVIRALRKEIAAGRPSIVFANGGATLPVAVGASPLGNQTLVYGSIGEPLFWAATPAARRRTGFLMRRADLVLAVSHATRRQIVEVLGVAPDRAEVVHPGVHPRFFDVEADPPVEALRVLFLGSLSAEKDPMAALEAISGALAKGPVHGRFVGGGPLRSDIEDEVARRRMGDHIEVVGPVADVTPHLRWADVLVLTSKSEGLPGVILEAGAAGVPAVAYEVGGIGDVITSGQTGELVERGEVGHLADHLVRLGADRSELARLGRAVRERVQDAFRHDQTIDRYDTLLRRLLDGAERP